MRKITQRNEKEKTKGKLPEDVRSGKIRWLVGEQSNKGTAGQGKTLEVSGEKHSKQREQEVQRPCYSWPICKARKVTVAFGRE